MRMIVSRSVYLFAPTVLVVAGLSSCNNQIDSARSGATLSSQSASQTSPSEADDSGVLVKGGANGTLALDQPSGVKAAQIHIVVLDQDRCSDALKHLGDYPSDLPHPYKPHWLMAHFPGDHANEWRMFQKIAEKLFSVHLGPPPHGGLMPPPLPMQPDGLASGPEDQGVALPPPVDPKLPAQPFPFHPGPMGLPPGAAVGSETFPPLPPDASGAIEASDAASSDGVALWGAPDHKACVVENVNQPYQAGQALSVSHIPDGNYTVEIVLEDAAGNPLQIGSGETKVVNGQAANVNIVFTKTAQPTEPTGSINVVLPDDPSGSSASSEASATSPVTASSGASAPANASSVVGLAFAASLSESVGACGPLQLSAVDAANNSATAASDLSIKLSSSASSGAFYADSACASAITTVTLAANASSLTVYYKDSAVGSPVITATPASGLVAASITATIK